jgi:alanine dehydrogenase
MAGLPLPDGTLVLTSEFIAHRVPPCAYIAAVREAFLQLAERQIETPPVGHIAGYGGMFHIKSAVRTAPPRRTVVKVNGNFPGNDALEGPPVIQGFIALLDATNGTLLALMDSGEITGRRTAAASALAAQLLARADSRRLALIGCGTQARFHLDVLCRVYALEVVELFDVRVERAESLAHRIRSLGIVARVHDSARRAVRTADIIVTTTPARAPVLDASDVPAGCFVAAAGADSAGKQELDPALLLRARVVPDVLAQALSMGDLQHVVAAGLMTAQDIHAEFAHIVAGRAAARTQEEQIFVFDSTGTAITDLAAAELVYESALADPGQLRVRLRA